MWKKNFLIILPGMLVGFLAVNLLYMMKHKKNRQEMLEGTILLYNKLDYMERNLRYGMHFDESRFPCIKDKKIVVSLSGKTCSSCIEKLLHLIDEKYNRKDDTLFLANYRSQQDFIVSFNDAWQLDYDYLFHPSAFFEPGVDNILVFKLEEGKVKYILEYKPEEEHFFEEYFVKYDF
jgi:hypothetical protein